MQYVPPGSVWPSFDRVISHFTVVGSPSQVGELGLGPHAWHFHRLRLIRHPLAGEVLRGSRGQVNNQQLHPRTLVPWDAVSIAPSAESVRSVVRKVQARSIEPTLFCMFMFWCYVVPRCAVLRCAVLRCVVLCCAVLWCGAVCCVALSFPCGLSRFCQRYPNDLILSTDIGVLNGMSCSPDECRESSPSGDDTISRGGDAHVPSGAGVGVLRC